MARRGNRAFRPGWCAMSTSWRNLITVHPAADLFPMMSQAELEELACDIAKNGLRHGVVLWTSERIEIENARHRKMPVEFYLLDGRNRLAAIELAHADEEDREEALASALYVDPAEE